MFTLTQPRPICSAAALRIGSRDASLSDHSPEIRETCLLKGGLSHLGSLTVVWELATRLAELLVLLKATGLKRL